MRSVFALKMLGGFFVGAAAAVGGWHITPDAVENRLGRDQLADYCRLMLNGGELQGGAGGALGWRCIDHSDPSFRLTVGLFDLNNYCRNRFPDAPYAAIRDIRRSNGWHCTTAGRAATEKTVEIILDPMNPPVGRRPRDQLVIPVVDSPNRYLDANGRMNLRARGPVKAFCVEPIADADGPPFMYGVITPTLQRGYVRSDFTASPSLQLPLPTCQNKQSEPT